MRIHHLNCGLLHAPPQPRAACHCLLVEHNGSLALVDTGIGLADVARPLERIPREAIEAAGYQFDASRSAIRLVEGLGFRADHVHAIALTHGDPDHVGGLADFPEARVHLSTEELASIRSGHVRYSQPQFDHEPRWLAHGSSTRRWFGLEARTIELLSGVESLLVPLFGHTLGHCGVAIRDGERWVLHVGDAYYLRAELSNPTHPVDALATLRADDDVQRRASLAELRRLARDHGDEIELLGYHDFSEFPVAALGV
jgi:glyoxylase-like metal-dependent hydrolase (beta-lactamase superfamily II)